MRIKPVFKPSLWGFEHNLPSNIRLCITIYIFTAHMTLIKSISGIRGTIGDKPGEGLTPHDILKFSIAYASWINDG
jgi:hypothetical protein